MWWYQNIDSTLFYIRHSINSWITAYTITTKKKSFPCILIMCVTSKQALIYWRITYRAIVETQSFSTLDSYRTDCFPSKTIHVLKNHTDEVWYVAFSNDGQYLASVSKDQTCVVWNMTVSLTFLWSFTTIIFVLIPLSIDFWGDRHSDWSLRRYYLLCMVAGRYHALDVWLR